MTDGYWYNLRTGEVEHGPESPSLDRAGPFETADEAYDYLAGELRDGDRVLVKSSNAAGLRHLGDRLGDLFT